MASEHLGGDGDGAITSGIELIYGREARHQPCVFHLLREYRGNIGAAGFAAMQRLPDAESLAKAKGYAAQARRETDGRRHTGARSR